MRRRGITLVELLLALSISILVMMAAGNAYVVGTRTAKSLGTGRDALARRAAFESSLRSLFAHAYLDADSTNATTYFVSGDALSGKSTSSGAQSNSSGDASSLVFTVLGRALPSTLLASADDFETNNEKFGALGGVREIQLGTQAIGAPTGGQEGLFLREQSPSDGDPTQGGTESLLSPDLDTISYEFFDGSQWQTSWDTTTMGARRLPAAVRVTYRFRTDTQDTILDFPLLTSDVTPDNPVAEETAG